MQDDDPRTIFNPEIKERVEKRLSATTDYIYSALTQIADLETEVDNDFLHKGTYDTYEISLLPGQLALIRTIAAPIIQPQIDCATVEPLVRKTGPITGPQMFQPQLSPNPALVGIFDGSVKDYFYKLLTGTDGSA